jgi:flagellar basal-body rod protein FlgB
MYQGVFQSTTIPVLEQVIGFAQARHVVLAGNIANLDTPGYRVRDLSVEDFQTRLREAIQDRHEPEPTAMSPGEIQEPDRSKLAEISENPKTILYHDDSNVGLEHQVTEMVKNQAMHNMALTIMASQFRLLEAAITERV